MIRNGIWYVFSLTDSFNNEKKWLLLLNQSRFPLEYVKRHVNILQKVSESDQYVVHNLMWSVVYLRGTFSNTLLYKVLTLVPLTATVPEVFVSAMTLFLSNSYDALDETLTHMNSLKLKSYPGENVIYLCAAILVDDERLESARTFKPDHLGYITRIFEDTPDSIFRFWAIHKYQEVTEFIKNLCVFDMDVISPEDIITYEFLVQEAAR